MAGKGRNNPCKNILKKDLTYKLAYDILVMQGLNGSPLQPSFTIANLGKEDEKVTATELVSVLTFIAVVIFGVVDIIIRLTKK